MRWFPVIFGCLAVLVVAFTWLYATLRTQNLAAAIRRHLDELIQLPSQKLKDLRYAKFRQMGAFVESGGLGLAS